MFDMHYDLLSVAYVAYLKNDYIELIKWCENYQKNNVRGVIANLYFMSKEEMKQELHPNYYVDGVSVIEMFQKSKELIETFLPETEIIYSIEGCDYLEVEDLDALYELGLRNILPVWNEKNKYGSGNRTKDGLTPAGKILLDKAIELNIAIDLSHTNEKTYEDCISYLKEKRKSNKEFIVWASHSNCRSLCDRERNLTDEQLKEMKNINGMVGALSNRNFVVSEEEKNTVTENQKRIQYIDHINRLVFLLGIDRVGVSTDDMNFCKDADSEYGEVAIYDYRTVAYTLRHDLATYYNDTQIEKIMYSNVKSKYDILMKEKVRRKK